MSKLLLLVEDNEALRYMYSLMLEELDFTVIAVSNGDKALEKFKNNTFDILLTDHRTDGMSGLELVKHVRRMPDTKFLPIVAVSAYDSPTIIHDFLLAGADRFLLKPVTRSDFAAEIIQAIENEQMIKKNLQTVDNPPQ